MSDEHPDLIADLIRALERIGVRLEQIETALGIATEDEDVERTPQALYERFKQRMKRR